MQAIWTNIISQASLDGLEWVFYLRLKYRYSIITILRREVEGKNVLYCSAKYNKAKEVKISHYYMICCWLVTLQSAGIELLVFDFRFHLSLSLRSFEHKREPNRPSIFGARNLCLSIILTTIKIKMHPFTGYQTIIALFMFDVSAAKKIKIPFFPSHTRVSAIRRNYYLFRFRIRNWWRKTNRLYDRSM